MIHEMIDHVKVQENKAFSERHADSEDRLFKVKVLPAVTLGLVFTTPSSRVLVWDGALDFWKLEHEALESLPHHISERSPRDFEQSRSVRASFIFSSEDLAEYHLDNPDQYEQYRQVMERPDQIKFVRYDVHDESADPALKYSFTAENSRLLDTDYGELAMKLPIRQPWSFQLVEWISQRHSAARMLRYEVDLESVAHALSTIGGEQSAQAGA